MDTLESGAHEAAAQSLPKELAMVTSRLKGEAINPEPGWREGANPSEGREVGQLSGIESYLRRRPTPSRGL